MNNIGNNMNMMNNIGNNMNMMNNIGNNMNMMNNIGNNMNMIYNNNMNGQLNNNMLEEQRRRKEDQRRREEEEEQKRKEEHKNKIIQFDFKRINEQNNNFNEIMNKLKNYIKDLEECIEYNNKITNDYSNNPYDKNNLTNLLKLSCSIVDIYEDKLKEIKNYINDIENIYKSVIKELKDNALNHFNKKYNTCLIDNNNVGFRNMLELGKLDEEKFNDFCLINFNKIQELELKFEDKFLYF